MNKKIVLLSLSVFLCAAASDSFAAVRVGNKSRSYADSYNQVAMMQQQATYDALPAYDQDALAVRVADADIAARILKNDPLAGATRTELESCSLIYPGGVFAWDKPTAGLKVSANAMCVSVVEMRVIRGTDDIIVARANIAAGDSIKCNISDFPESSYTTDASSITFPADKEPTVDDVIGYLNNEQKKNAGFKIAASAVVGGLIGNVSGKNDIGNDGLIGTDSGKMGGAVIGALSGAAIGAGGSYAGKVGGDVIMSAGINGAAGGAIGNMVASGDSVLRIEDCEIFGAKQKCLWGVIEKNVPLKDNEIVFYNIADGATVVCPDGGYEKCKNERIISLSFDEYKSVSDGAADSNFLKIKQDVNKQFSFDAKTGAVKQGMTTGNDMWILAKSGGRPSGRIAAMVPYSEEKIFGSKMSDWYKWRSSNSFATMYTRNAKGEAGEIPKSADSLGAISLNDFYPVMLDSGDGGIIDLNNKARLKSTMVGAGAGAGLGAFTAYQGAQNDIDVAWVSSVTEYKDSLQKVYCATGTRFLSQYNDVVVIPNIATQ